jgi:hypothetical protein
LTDASRTKPLPSLGFLTANFPFGSHKLAPAITTTLDNDAASLAATLPAPPPLVAVTTIWVDANAAGAYLKGLSPGAG